MSSRSEPWSVRLRRAVRVERDGPSRAHRWLEGAVWASVLAGVLTLWAPLGFAAPLSRPEVTKLLRKNVQEPRLLAVVRELGIDFKVTAEVMDELIAAGASPTLIAELLALAGSKDQDPPAAASPSPSAPPASPGPPAPPLATSPPSALAPEPSEATTASVDSRPTTVSPPDAPPSPPEPTATPRASSDLLARIPAPPPVPPPPGFTAPGTPALVPEASSPVSAAVFASPPPPAPVAPGPDAAPAGDASARAGAPPAASKSEQVKPLLERAHALALEGDIRGAQEQVAKAMELDAGDPEVWKAFKGIELDLLARAETFLADGQVPRALREFQFVITKNPESALGHNGVGLALLQLKNYEGAVAAFERALALDPGNARYRQALTQARSLQKASKALERTGQENLQQMLGEQPGKKRP